MPEKAKLEKIVSKDPTVPVLAHPFLRIEPDGSGTLLASDKFTAVVIPVEVTDEDTAGPVHIEAVKASRKLGGTIRCEPGYCVVPAGVAFPRDQYGQFPPVDQLLVPEGQADVEVSINARTLYALAQAMGTDVVKLRIQRDTDTLPVGVEPHPSEPHVEGARAMLMPYRIPGSA